MINMKSAFLFTLLVTILLGSSLTDSFLISRAKRQTNGACSQRPSTGHCLALFIRYYYNATSNTCNKFIYGGCGGSDNNFRTGEKCTEACGGTVVEIEDRYAPIIVPEPDTDDICNLPPETGLCRAGFINYYFNGNKCETFVYGGCRGNANNFKTEEDCLERCGHKITGAENDI